MAVPYIGTLLIWEVEIKRVFKISKRPTGFCLQLKILYYRSRLFKLKCRPNETRVKQFYKVARPPIKFKEPFLYMLYSSIS